MIKKKIYDIINQKGFIFIVLNKGVFMNYISFFLGYMLKNIYIFFNNYGCAIIILTILLKTLLLPVSVKQMKSSYILSELNPKIKEIQEKYKNKPEEINKKISQIYKENHYNPLSGCLPLIIQMPILLALYWVFRDPVNYGVFLNNNSMEIASSNFLWIKTLSKPDVIMAVISGISAYLMQINSVSGEKINAKDSVNVDNVQKTSRILNVIVPGMSLFWGLYLPSSLTLYWSVSNLVSFLQYRLINNILYRG